MSWNAYTAIINAGKDETKLPDEVRFRRLYSKLRTVLSHGEKIRLNMEWNVLKSLGFDSFIAKASVNSLLQRTS